MPSLNDLGKFKSSFNDIANEKNDIKARNMPFDDLELPGTEAPPFDFPRESFSSPGKNGQDSSLDVNEFLNDLPDEESPLPIDTPVGGGLSALDDFLKEIIPESDKVEPAAADFSTDDLADFGDFDTGEQNLEEESAPADFGTDDLPDFGDLGDFDAGEQNLEEEPAPADFGADDLADFGDLGDFDTGEQNLEEEPAPADFGADDLADFGDLGDFDTGEQNLEDEPDPADFSSDDSDDFGAIDMGGESLDGVLVDEDDPDFPQVSDSSDVDDLSFDTGFDDDGIDMGGESLGILSEESNDDGLMSDFDSPLPEDDFSSLDFPDPDFSDAGEDSEPLHEMGDLGADFESTSIDLDTNEVSEQEIEFSTESFSSDDFNLPGLDDIFDKTKPEPLSTPEPAPKKGLFGRKKAKAEDLPEAEDSVEEIALEQEDVDRLLRTLSSYPLNLRIACQELIAEQVILPQQLSKLIRLLVSGAHIKETAAHVEEITGKPIVIPKSFEKMTGAAFEAEQSSFAYIFIHNFLPVLRLFAIIAIIAASVFYLSYRFIYLPLRAESIYRRGYERIYAGEFQRANELFNQAFEIHRRKGWFYSYAEAFIEQRRFTLAEQKYEMLLRFYPRDKKGVLDYARLNTVHLMNFEKANRLLQRELLDFTPDDVDGLLAAGDNFLLWADSNPQRFFDRYEDARFHYARLLELRGWQPPIVERMLMYFIRTDNLREVIYLRHWFEGNSRHIMSTATLAELGGYLLDKQLESPVGVPNPYIESIESVRDMLLQAVFEDPYLPEPHYHLARYHHALNNRHEERLTLENAIRAFDLARTESVRRRLSRVDTHFRYANLLINSREFFPAEEQAIRGIQLFEDFRDRNLITNSPALGQLYSMLGDLEFFVKTGDMEAALRNYRTAEVLGYSPPEVQYRMGAAYYQLEDWRNALEHLFRASAELPFNRRLLFALGNAAFQRGDFFAAQGYYTRLLDMLEVQRIRLPVLLPNDNIQFLETGERLMMARNNLGVAYEAIADQTGNRSFRDRALGMYAESARAWDSITRNPETMIRMRLTDSPGAPSINLGYLNANNALRPSTDYQPQIFIRIDRDVFEPSRWEELTR